MENLCKICKFNQVPNKKGLPYCGTSTHDNPHNKSYKPNTHTIFLIVYLSIIAT